MSIFALHCTKYEPGLRHHNDCSYLDCYFIWFFLIRWLELTVINLPKSTLTQSTAEEQKLHIQHISIDRYA